MKRTIFILVSVAAMVITAFIVSIEAQGEAATTTTADRTQKQQERQQRRAERLAAYEKYVDSLVLSRNFRFVPQTMQQMPAGMMRNLVNPNYEVAFWDTEVDVCIPYLKGYTPPYYPVVFNYVLTSVEHLTTEQTNDGWHLTFSTSMFSATTYTFSMEIYSRYGGATLSISNPFYNTVQYTGNIFAI